MGSSGCDRWRLAHANDLESLAGCNAVLSHHGLLPNCERHRGMLTALESRKDFFKGSNLVSHVRRHGGTADQNRATAKVRNHPRRRCAAVTSDSPDENVRELIDDALNDGAPGFSLEIRPFVRRLRAHDLEHVRVRIEPQRADDAKAAQHPRV